MVASAASFALAVEGVAGFARPQLLDSTMLGVGAGKFCVSVSISCKSFKHSVRSRGEHKYEGTPEIYRVADSYEEFERDCTEQVSKEYCICLFS